MWEEQRPNVGVTRLEAVDCLYSQNTHCPVCLTLRLTANVLFVLAPLFFLDVTFAAKGYFDALVRMGELASESQGSKDLGKWLTFTR